jgi:hypothetical protein
MGVRDTIAIGIVIVVLVSFKLPEVIRISNRFIFAFVVIGACGRSVFIMLRLWSQHCQNILAIFVNGGVIERVSDRRVSDIV